MDQLKVEKERESELDLLYQSVYLYIASVTYNKSELVLLAHFFYTCLKHQLTHQLYFSDLPWIQRCMLLYLTLNFLQLKNSHHIASICTTRSELALLAHCETNKVFSVLNDGGPGWLCYKQTYALNDPFQ